MVDRYARQSQIPGWHQDRLEEARITVIGSGYLAGFVIWGLAALGVGQLFLLDDRVLDGAGPVFPCLEAAAGQAAVKALERTVSRINPHTRVSGIRVRLLYDAHRPAIPDCDVIVEATTDSQSKQICLKHSRAQGIPLILASAGETDGRCSVVSGHGEPWGDFVYRDHPQGVIPSQVIGALVLEEVRKLILPLKSDQSPVGSINYDLTHPGRFGTVGQAVYVKMGRRARRHHGLIIGAGALGTYVGLGLAIGGIKKLTIVDPDVVDETNLNRQVLFYDAVGRPKATELAIKLNQLAPDVEIVGIVASVAEKHFQGIDVAFACVDNFKARAQVNAIAVHFGVPLVNGGSGPFSGELQVYQPGKTACLGCHIGVDSLADAEVDRRAHCGHVPEASIVISNLMIGGLMVGEAERVFRPETFGEPLAGIIEYDAFHPARLGIRSARAPCQCHTREHQ